MDVLSVGQENFKNTFNCLAAGDKFPLEGLQEVAPALIIFNGQLFTLQPMEQSEDNPEVFSIAFTVQCNEDKEALAAFFQDVMDGYKSEGHSLLVEILED